MKKGYCENCNEFVKYKIEEKEDSIKIRNRNYNYIKVIGYCEKCGEEISANEITDENLKRIDEAYRNIEGIIKRDEIELILKKYVIGKRPLSKLLGWGEVTLSRYIDGDVPTKPYSDELYKILNDKNHMSDILEINKSSISEKAYNSVRKAILNEKNDYIMKDIDLVANYIIFKTKEITPLALQKILYYSQGFYKAFFDEFLFVDDCEAWVHGPVYPEIYDKYKVFKSANIEEYIEDNICDILDNNKITLLNVIINFFAYYNGKALEKMTHYEKPWILARKGIPNDIKSKEVIKKEVIEEYFSSIKDKYNMLNLLDIKKYSEDQFRSALSVIDC